jgi:hypothetical protein
MGEGFGVSERVTLHTVNIEKAKLEQRFANSHCLVWLYGEKVMVAPCQMRRTDNHQTADVAVCRDVAYFRKTSRTEETLALQF